MVNPILTKHEADKLLKIKEGSARISLNLGLSETEISVKGGFAEIKGQKILLDDVKKIKEDFCYLVEDGKLAKIAFFSPESSLYYKLSPAKDWPTIRLSSVPMHRHIKISPKEDTESKIKEIMPVKGNVLDTCCGLGYTAIMASKNADIVYTFERDEYVLHVAGINPHSKELFTSRKIKLIKKDVNEGIKELKDAYFDRIMHDPPTFSISPELYSIKFYTELYRVMKKGGILYHYAPWPGKTKGKEFYQKIINNLEGCGFRNIAYHSSSSGVVARKI